jgi:hypothetical protein
MTVDDHGHDESTPGRPGQSPYLKGYLEFSRQLRDLLDRFASELESGCRSQRVDDLAAMRVAIALVRASTALVACDLTVAAPDIGAPRAGRATQLPRSEARARGEKRYRGKVCAKHPEYGGERATRTRKCLGCHRDRQRKLRRQWRLARLARNQSG